MLQRYLFPYSNVLGLPANSHIFQSMKTKVIKNTLNPIWNERLMLSIPDPIPPLKLVCIHLFLTFELFIYN